MTDSLEDLKLQFKQRMATEKRLLEKACRIIVNESVVSVPVDEAEIVKRALGGRIARVK